MSPVPRHRPLHPEHTADPVVVRWVTHHPRLAGSPPGPRVAPSDTPLGVLVAAGVVTTVVLSGDDVLIGAPSPDRWAALPPRVLAALEVELDRLDGPDHHWLLDPTAPGDGPPPPTVTEVQATVDRATATVLAAHGGAMTVTAVVAGTVLLRAERACTGCHQADDTVLGLIAPAVRASHPGIAVVSLDTGPTSPVPGPVPGPPGRRSRFRLTWPGGSSCH